MAHRSTLAEHREVWSSTETDPPGQEVGTVDLLIVHHFYRPDVPADASVEEERVAMRQVEHYHTEGEQEWDDLGYQFVVFDSGRPYEGRGWSHSGAHTVGENQTSFAIAFAINGNEREPTEEAWATARSLVREGIGYGYITRDYEIAGHRDYAQKDCPGHEVYPLLEAKLGPKTLHGEEDDMPLNEDDLAKIRQIVQDEVEQVLVTFERSRLVQHDLKAKINDSFHRNREIKAMVSELAAATGVDPDKLAQAVREELAEALAGGED